MDMSEHSVEESTEGGFPGNGSEVGLGRSSSVVPGRFGEPLEISHAVYSRGGGRLQLGRPLFLCLHGWGSNELDLADMMRYVAPGNDYVSLRAPLVLEAEAPGEFGSGAGAYSWFHDSVPSGEDRDRDIYAAAKAVDDWVSGNIDAQRQIVPIGFSQGAALAVHLLRIHPERYRAVIALSGFLASAAVPGVAPGDVRLPSLEVPVFYGYGARDSVLPKYESAALAAWLNECSWPTIKEYRTLDHAVSLEEFGDIRQWLVLHNISSGVV
ncbi:phospholipase/carboxylesterase [Bifidobacterium bombi DSM 19703]|uniref:Phospholipase/carboxylesterase n=2 Tax=Bifidobacterium bombi TaxID=471511 RepID=A0A086BPF2_9BIFI|nr:phospholipase/carboxylesterase [Bifidobacterium bombi DSM 19703]